MNAFKTRDLMILAVVSIAAIFLLILMGTSWAYAIGWTAFFAVIALIATYFKSRRSP